jgi:hypothetical protein
MIVFLLEIWWSLNCTAVISKSNIRCSMTIGAKHSWLVTPEEQIKNTVSVFCRFL